MEKSVRDILEGMEWEGEKIFLMVTRIKGGHVGAFFSNVIDSCKERVIAISKHPAAQIYWKAYKRGVYVEDINKLLVHCFDVREVNKIPNSRYSKTTKMAVVDSCSSVNFESLYKDSSLIDFTKGLTPEEKRNREVKQGIRFGEVFKGSPAAYNFNSSSSVKTATKGKKPTVGPKVIPEGESMAKSVFSLDAKTTVAPDEEEDVDSFDADSIESAESLLQEEAMRREEAAIEAETNRVRGMEVNTDETGPDADESPRAEHPRWQQRLREPRRGCFRKVGPALWTTAPAGTEPGHRLR